MAIAEISVVPLGTGGPSLSRYVAQCVKALDCAGIKYQLTPMGTVLEGNLEDLLDAVRILHRVPFNNGAARVLTRVVIDERTDKAATADDKVKSVLEKVEANA